MKRFLIFLFAITLLVSCQKNELGDPDKLWIKIHDAKPGTGSTITKTDTVWFKVSYNIPDDILEGNGFVITYWCFYDDDPYNNSDGWYNLKIRKETYPMRFIIKNTDGSKAKNKFGYYVTLAKKTTGTQSEIIAESTKLNYLVKQ